MKHYYFASAPLIQLHGTAEKAAEALIPLVHNNTLWFPFQRHFNGAPAELFVNLKTLDLPIRNWCYKLYSYYPQFGSFLPPLFRNSFTVIVGSQSTYKAADVLSDHYIEHIRLKAKRYDQIHSVLECWEDDMSLKEILKIALQKDYITPETLRQSIHETIPETKIFNPTWARTLLKLVLGPNLVGKKWLDISAGWGDRLLAAMSLDMDYLGYDPNVELKPGHSAMIKDFGDIHRHRVFYEPFETAQIPGGPYDVVLTSPPFFTIEEYVPAQQGQSIVNYPNFDIWMVHFLFRSLNNAWAQLKDEGYLILHLGDAKTIVTAEATNIFIENFLPFASYEGVIGLQGEAGFPRPVWVWKKTSPYYVWEPASSKVHSRYGPLPYAKRKLYYTYNGLHGEYVRWLTSQLAPSYAIRHKSAEIVRALTQTRVSDLFISSLLETQGVEITVNLLRENQELNINTLAPYYEIRKQNAYNVRGQVSTKLIGALRKAIIDDILSDDLMLSCLLEILTIEDTIAWAVDIVYTSSGSD